MPTTLNIWQRLVLIVGTILLLKYSLFPPYLVTGEYRETRVAVSRIVFGPIVSPPKSEDLNRIEGYSDIQVEKVELDHPRALLLLVATVGGTIGGCGIFSRRRIRVRPKNKA